MTSKACSLVVCRGPERVCEAIRLVFLKFRERWTIRQTFMWFRDHDIELPANPVLGTGLVWKVPTQALVRDILLNPFYAGAYVWGRRPVETILVEVSCKSVRVPFVGPKTAVCSSATTMKAT